MPIVGAVIDLPESIPARAALLERLRSEPACTVGAMSTRSVAIAVETVTTREGRMLLESLGAMEGVRGVHPVFHSFEDELDARAAEREAAAMHASRQSAREEHR